MTSRFSLMLFLAVAAASLAAAGAALTGPVDASLPDILTTLGKLARGLPLDDGTETILGHIRLPRVAVAALCGSALAAAGCVSQALFRNPLASPSIVGSESGGAFAAALMFYTGSAFASAYALPGAAMIGSAVATIIVFAVGSAAGWQRLESLLLAGFAINTLFAAMTSLTVSLSLEDYQKSAAMMHWLLGGFQARGWDHAGIGLVCAVIGFVISWRIAPRLDVLSLGEEHAATLGVKTKSLRLESILVIGVLSGSAVAIAGAIPFIGLVVPHMGRLLLGPNNRRLLLFSVFAGAALVLCADILARTVRAPAEMETGIITALIGAPYFLWLLVKQQKQKKGQGS